MKTNSTGADPAQSLTNNDPTTQDVLTLPSAISSAQPGSRQVGYARLAKLLAVAAISGTLVAFSFGVYFVISSGDSVTLIWGGIISLLISTAYAIVGMLVASRYPRNPIGWIFLAVSWLDAFGLIFTVYHTYGPTVGATGYVPAIFHDLWLPALLLPLIFVFLLFPDGRLISPWWRIVFCSAALGLAGNHIAWVMHPGPLPGSITEVIREGIAGSASGFDIVLVLTRLLLWVGIFGSVTAFAIRFRHSSGIERQQMKWLGYALGLMLLSMAFGAITINLWAGSTFVTDLRDAITNLALLGIAVATGIAILRHRLYDIDVVINRTLVYAALTTIIILFYVLVVGTLGSFFQAQGNLLIALLATGLVAVLFQPLRERLQRGVNQLIFGVRDDPIEALSRLGRRLDSALTPDEVLPTLVETIAQTLKLPYVAILLPGEPGDRVAAAYGEQSPQPVSLPLTHQGQPIGQLVVAPRSPDNTFSPSELRLLQNIARQAGSAVQAAELTDDLQRSRQRLVTAREEERRRLRRDLHDGLGPTLAALHVQTNALRRVIQKDPKAADGMVVEFDAEIREAIDDIRRVVYELRPPTLDELGLIGATRAYATQCSREVRQQSANDPDYPVEGMLSVQVDAPTELSPLPAAIEVAAYHIIREALTNVVHHAQARQCFVRFHLTDALIMEIEDDGLGLPAEHHAGVGLLSMRERTEELGGTFTITPGPNGGTSVRAQFPLLEA